MAKFLSKKQMTKRKFKYMDDLSDRMSGSLGHLSRPFTCIVWGQSGNGKSNFVMQLVYELRSIGKILYLSLEEGLEASFYNKVEAHLLDREPVDIQFADPSVKLQNLIEKLDKKRSARLVVIDSLQYFGINYPDFKHLKERYPKKSWIFISHAKGNFPAGVTADKVRYDSGVKIKVEGKVAFIESRYGGNKPWIIWEEGAKAYWGKKFKSIKKRASD